MSESQMRIIGRELDKIRADRELLRGIAIGIGLLLADGDASNIEHSKRLITAIRRHEEDAK